MQILVRPNKEGCNWELPSLFYYPHELRRHLLYISDERRLAFSSNDHETIKIIQRWDLQSIVARDFKSVSIVY